jgi:hypothetical protein
MIQELSQSRSHMQRNSKGLELYGAEFLVSCLSLSYPTAYNFLRNRSNHFSFYYIILINPSVTLSVSTPLWFSVQRLCVMLPRCMLHVQSNRSFRPLWQCLTNSTSNEATIRGGQTEWKNCSWGTRGKAATCSTEMGDQCHPRQLYLLQNCPALIVQELDMARRWLSAVEDKKPPCPGKNRPPFCRSSIPKVKRFTA